MQMHKRTKPTPLVRQEIWAHHQAQTYKTKTSLALAYHVSRPTLDKVLERASYGEFAPRKSTRKDYMSITYGLRRLAKIEAGILERKRKEAQRYNKAYPGELMHIDCKRMPLLKGESKRAPREYLFVAIDDCSRELYADILPDKSQFSSAAFLDGVIKQCPYTIDYMYSDNGKEFKGTEKHAFVKRCADSNIGQRFTRVASPQTNGKAERVIRTIMEMWHDKMSFASREHRQNELVRFVNFYNTTKPHKGLDNKTPFEVLYDFFYSD